MNNNDAIFLLLLSLTVFLLPPHASSDTRVGTWSPIGNIKNPHVIEIGKFAVCQYNEQSQSGLKFKMVLRGATQVISGKKYRLLMVASNGCGESEDYEAIVWEKPGLKSLKLLSFKLAST